MIQLVLQENDNLTWNQEMMMLKSPRCLFVENGRRLSFFVKILQNHVQQGLKQEQVI